jgi:CRISPR-associated protein (TIGR03986 family)
MSPRHSSPSYDRARRESKTRKEVWARAPYNFVPLPEKVVTVDLPPDQDEYSGNTGHIDCQMETFSPTYIRGMLTPALLKQLSDHEKKYKDKKKLTQQEKEQKDTEERRLKEQMAPFFALNNIPFIPGSSLRGMFRTLVEIISYGKMRWVGKEPTFSFRAVAAQKDDPLRDPYREIIGSFGKNVRAGYLRQHGENWSIQPARMPSELGLPEQGAYLKVKEWLLSSKNFPEYRRFDSPDYLPQIHEVSFDVEVRPGKRGKYAAISQIGTVEAGFRYKGALLVTSGNMLETAKSGQTSPRKNQALVLEASSSKEIPINPQAVRDYKLSLTQFQKDNLGDWEGGEWGCLRNGAPVFYVWTGREKEVIYFGHSPNFRVPVRLPGLDHASTPLDFVPLELRADELTDLADALFGWTPEPGSKRKDACAGRVFFSDAHLLSDGGDIWYDQLPVAPHVLSGPKATTFQHYLTQDRNLGHDPDSKQTLAHYGTPRTETQIRGYKHYWHRGQDPDIKASDKEREHESQLTRIQPLKAGVRFSFRIHFENLRDYELGALLWALQPRGSTDETYVHKIGMGKPLGMGAIYMDQANLHITDRKNKRYAGLFGDGDGFCWDSGEVASDEDFASTFEQYILAELEGIAPQAVALVDLDRIRELLTMMAWRGDDPGNEWLGWTRYMEIEQGSNKLNEYKERPVLPRPTDVVRWFQGQPTAPDRTLKDEIPKNLESQAVDEVETKEVTESAPPTWPPTPGTLLWGKVIDIDPDGIVWAEIIASPQPADEESIAAIHPDQIQGKQYQEEQRIRLEVIESQEDAGGWLIQCKPGSGTIK